MKIWLFGVGASKANPISGTTHPGPILSSMTRAAPSHRWWPQPGRDCPEGPVVGAAGGSKAMNGVQTVSSPFLRNILFSAVNPQVPHAPCQTSWPASRAQLLCGAFVFVSKFPIAEELCLGRQGKRKEDYFVLKYKIKVNFILIQEKKNTPKSKVTENFYRELFWEDWAKPCLLRKWFSECFVISHLRTPFPSVGLLTWTQPSPGSGDQCPAVSQPGLLATGEGWRSRGMPDFQRLLWAGSADTSTFPLTLPVLGSRGGCLYLLLV